MTEEKKPDVWQLPEAPASITIKYYDANGFDTMLTLRDFDTKSLLVRAGEAGRWLLEHGAHPQGGKSNGNSGPPAAMPASSTPPPVSGAPPAQAQASQQELSFPAERMVGNVSKGKTYWKVQGGTFSQYGVTAWPEVLKAADFDTDSLDVTKEYDLTGFTAFYVLNDKGKPDKVTRLVK